MSETKTEATPCQAFIGHCAMLRSAAKGEPVHASDFLRSLSILAEQDPVAVLGECRRQEKLTCEL